MCDSRGRATLFAWSGRTPVGRFGRDCGGRYSFEYEPGASQPVSLSLPLSGGWRGSAPRNYLEGLLPEDGVVRERMARSLGADGVEPIDLLPLLDVAGGLTFTAGDEPPSPDGGEAEAMTEDDVASEFRGIHASCRSWPSGDPRRRFSLAGAQGKLAVRVREDGAWLWPSAAAASTHVVKPDGRALRDVAAVESATLDLARLVGLEVPDHTVVRRGGVEGLLEARFDRARPAAGQVARVHAEDLAQALGIGARGKYDVLLTDVASLFARSGLGAELTHAFLEQVIFNTHVGNNDAHAKNYSLVHGPGGTRMSPLYDAISMGHWPELRNSVLGIEVNGKVDGWEVTLGDWCEAGRSCGLDGERVAEDARRIVGALVGLRPGDIDAPEPIAADICDQIRAYTRDIRADVAGARAHLA